MAPGKVHGTGDLLTLVTRLMFDLGRNSAVNLKKKDNGLGRYPSFYPPGFKSKKLLAGIIQQSKDYLADQHGNLVGDLGFQSPAQGVQKPASQRLSDIIGQYIAHGDYQRKA